MSVKWENYFYYDESSPSFLKWNVEIRTGRNMKRVLISKGDNAGCIFKTPCTNYWRVQLNKKNILVHRIIYCLHNKSIDDKMFVDHLDGNGLNNNIDNLRLADNNINARNTTRRRDNTSGVVGVSLKTEIENTGKINTYWIAQCNDLLGSSRSKCFSTNKYGYDKAFQLACEWRQKMILELNAQGAGYTERHGK